MIKLGSRWYEPSDILQEMTNPIHEMSAEQHAFLCALIKEYMPQKVVEVGVAEGGTSSVIMRALEMISPNARMFSVDLNENLYYDSTRKTGYLLDEVKGNLTNSSNHSFMLGHYLPEVIDTIGDGIDMVVIDTVHCMPGEYLDFLCILPYLNNGAIVLLHDITLSLKSAMSQNAICTPSLFGAIIGEKIWNFNDESADNLAAVIVDKKTVDNMDNVFAMFFLPWQYMPSEYELNLYRKIIKRHYSDDEYEMFECALKKQIALKNNKESEREEQISRYITECNIKNRNVYIYGSGKYGRGLKVILEKFGISIKSFVVSDDQIINDEQKKDTIYLKDYDNDGSNALFYAINNRSILHSLIVNDIKVLEWPYGYEE